MKIVYFFCLWQQVLKIIINIYFFDIYFDEYSELCPGTFILIKNFVKGAEMNNLIHSECEREIKKITRTIIILITLNICPVYAGNGHLEGPRRLSPSKILLGSNRF